MAFKDIFKVSRKTFVNPRAWFDYDSVKNSFILTWQIIGGLFVPPETQRKETFEEALARLNVTEDDLQERAKSYALYAFIFIACAVGTALFGFYLLFFIKTFLGFMLAVAVTALFLSQAFRYDFWHFQMKQRKLGCTFDEWWRGKLNTNQDKP